MVESQASNSIESAKRPFFVGVDVGGTNTKIGVVDYDGRIFGKVSISTLEERGPADAIQRMARAIDQLLAQLKLSLSDVAAVGLGTPGTQDIRRHIVFEPPNMAHWRNYPVRDELALACKKPCAYANDANAAAYGEFWVGSGRNHPSMVMFTLGTG